LKNEKKIEVRKGDKERNKKRSKEDRGKG